MADGRGTEVILNDLDQLLTFRRLQEALGGIELDPLGGKALQRDAPDIGRRLGHLGGEALPDQRVEDIRGGAAQAVLRSSDSTRKTRPNVATTSLNHCPGLLRAVTDACNSGRSNIACAPSTPSRAPANCEST